MNETAARYLNRELSWLEFNDRVLQEARDGSNPLLERLKFLAITGSNLDEFFMVRVGGLQLLAKQGGTKSDPAGMTPAEQLQAISQRTHAMTADQYECLNTELEPGLSAAGINRIGRGELSDRQWKVVEQVFEDEIYPILSPMAVTSSDDFPLLLNQTLNVCVRLEPSADDPETSRFALIPFGRSEFRFITLPSAGGYDYILLEEVVGIFIGHFFPGEQVVECIPFRITRNADLSVREDLAADLLVEMEEVLDARKQSDCARLEIADQTSDELRAFLQQTLDVRDEDVYVVPGPLDLSAFMRLTELQGFDDLKSEPWPARPSPAIDSAMSIFDVLSRRDVLLSHPYESFEPVLRLVEEAADDPDVLAIKQILYRTSRNSPIVKALISAAERGKYVTAIVELKARFDEARNIEWAKNLEQAGVQVIYGVRGLKTHAKLCVVVRREAHGVQRYVHFGTGNYNEITAKLYSDVSFMTSNDELAADATSFFNAVTGYSQPQKFRKIEMAPIGLREKLLEMIGVETELRKQGSPASIMAKLNSLADPELIDALYAASQAGVRIHLNVRGICCLRPGVPGLSENITVISIVDRLLEHSRILYCQHGGDERLYISSADWMPRNLDRRVELLVPIEDATAREQLFKILKTTFEDNVKARQLLPDGSYRRLQPNDHQKRIRSQEVLYRRACKAVLQAEQSRRTIFEPHQASDQSIR